ncbi:MAG: RagB/SusD family nutrient uptake outer membrane protein [Prevotellaceae bacterium]|jgi:hypothetical protein|nr:RagB/SusD family nutrient uptake outer membrane protein [Prevotellaceae bacterium]
MISKIKYRIGKAACALLACTLYLCAPSCNSYLNVDEYFLETTQLDSIFQRKELLIQYIRGAASYLPNEGNLFTSSPNPFGLASDECFTSWNDNRHAGMKYLLDEVTPFSTYFNNYPNYYQGIRKANMVLLRIHEVTDLETDALRDYMGLCYFLKGYYTYLLLLQYGPVPIVPDEPFAVDADVETLSLERSSYDECIAYICRNMELAHEFLPQERTLTEANMPDYGVPLAVMSRILLYAASPQYNGNATLYGGWNKKDGTPFINPVNENSKWGRAAAAAKRVMELEGGNKYELYYVMKESGSYDVDSFAAQYPEMLAADPNFLQNFPNGAGGIDPYKSYTYIFNGEATRALNKEIIYSCTPAHQGDSPLWIASPKIMSGGNGLNLTQDMVDAYRMADGKEINGSPLYPVGSEAYAPGGKAATFSDYTLQPEVVKMYLNREPRFYATVGFNYSYWQGTTYTGDNAASYTNLAITYYSDGNSGTNSVDYPEDYNRTGYTCRKYIHPEDNMRASSSVRPKIYPIFRYAEILLNYAEALNELGGSYTDTVSGITVSFDPAEILKHFNIIRYRSGIPGVATYPGQDEMRRLIKRERQVEFMCEGRRYHDLRRWGEDALTAYNAPIRGMNVKARKGDPAENFYSPIVINNVLTRRQFQHKNYFCPIPRTAINKNANLVQNPGW